MQKSMEIYKSKTQANQGKSGACEAAALSRRRHPDPPRDDGQARSFPGRGWRGLTATFEAFTLTCTNRLVLLMLMPQLRDCRRGADTRCGEPVARPDSPALSGPVFPAVRRAVPAILVVRARPRARQPDHQPPVPRQRSRGGDAPDLRRPSRGQEQRDAPDPYGRGSPHVAGSRA